MNSTSPGKKAESKNNSRVCDKRGKLSLRNKNKENTKDMPISSTLNDDDNLDKSMDCFAVGGKNPRLPVKEKLSDIPKTRGRIKKTRCEQSQADVGKPDIATVNPILDFNVTGTKNCNICQQSVAPKEMSTHLRQCFTSKYSRNKKGHRYVGESAGLVDSNKAMIVLCQICQIDIGDLNVEDREEHVNKCIDAAYNRKSKDTTPSFDTCSSKKTPEDEAIDKTSPTIVSLSKFKAFSNDPLAQEIQSQCSQSGSRICHICQKDISGLDVQWRTKHVNRCCEKIEQEECRKKEEAEALEKARNKVLDCPLCGKSFKSSRGRQTHLKKCANSLQVTPQVLMKRVKEQEKEYKMQLEAGILPTPKPAPKRKRRQNESRGAGTSSSTSRSATNEMPQNKFDEDTQLAIALSTSALHEEGKSSSNLGSCGQTSVSVNNQDAFSLIMSPKPRKKPGKRKKDRMENMLTDLITMTDEEQQEKMAKRIERVLLGKPSDDAYKIGTPCFKKSSTRSKYIESGTTSDGLEERLWMKHASVKNKTETSYYVDDLKTHIKANMAVSDRNCLTKRDSITGSARRKSTLSKTLNETTMVATTQTAFMLAELDTETLNRSNFAHGINDSFLDPPETGRKTLRFAEDDNLQINTLEETGFCVKRVDKKLQAEMINTMTGNFGSMVNNPTMSDVTIVTRDSSIHTHKFVLGCRAPKMLQDLDDPNSSLLLRDFPASSVLDFLEHLYTGSAELPHDSVYDMKKLAERYGLELLRIACEEEIRSNSISPPCEVDQPVDYNKSVASLLKAAWGSDSEDESHSESDNDREKISQTKRTDSDSRLSSSPASPDNGGFIPSMPSRHVEFQAASDDSQSDEEVRNPIDQTLSAALLRSLETSFSQPSQNHITRGRLCARVQSPSSLTQKPDELFVHKPPNSWSSNDDKNDAGEMITVGNNSQNGPKVSETALNTIRLDSQISPDLPELKYRESPNGDRCKEELNQPLDERNLDHADGSSVHGCSPKLQLTPELIDDDEDIRDLSCTPDLFDQTYNGPEDESDSSQKVNLDETLFPISPKVRYDAAEDTRSESPVFLSSQNTKPSVNLVKARLIDSFNISATGDSNQVKRAHTSTSSRVGYFSDEARSPVPKRSRQNSPVSPVFSKETFPEETQSCTENNSPAAIDDLNDGINFMDDLEDEENAVPNQLDGSRNEGGSSNDSESDGCVNNAETAQGTAREDIIINDDFADDDESPAYLDLTHSSPEMERQIDLTQSSPENSDVNADDNIMEGSQENPVTVDTCSDSPDSRQGSPPATTGSPSECPDYYPDEYVPDEMFEMPNNLSFSSPNTHWSPEKNIILPVKLSEEIDIGLETPKKALKKFIFKKTKLSCRETTSATPPKPVPGISESVSSTPTTRPDAAEFQTPSPIVDVKTPLSLRSRLFGNPSNTRDGSPPSLAEEFDPPTDMDTDTSFMSVDVETVGCKIKSPTKKGKSKVKKSSKPKAPRAPQTPMPHYSIMETPELQKQVKKFGVKALPKKKMIGVLKHIHTETHTYETESENEGGVILDKEPEAPASTQHGSKSSAASSTSVPVAGTSHNASCSESDSSSDELGSFCPEESIIDSSPQKSKGSADAKRKGVWDHIKGNEKLQLKIMLYEPIEFAEFQEELKSLGVNIGATLLMEFLDDHAIPFTMRNADKVKEQRRTKKKNAKKQKKS